MQTGITTFNYLVNGEFTAQADSDVQYLINSIPETIKDMLPEISQNHNIKLLDVSAQEDEPQVSGLWTFHFQAIDIALSDINKLFLKPIAFAWDMNLIDQVFESIHLDHHYKESDKAKEYNRLSDITITIRAFC
jgi:hypothetical protein